MLPNKVPRNASEALMLIEKRLQRLEMKGHGFSIPSTSASGLTTYSQDTEPTPPIVDGSIWIDTNAGNTIYRYSNLLWRLALDPAIDRIRDEAAVAVASAQDPAGYLDNKVVLYYRATTPPIGAVGDLWVNSSTNQLYRSDATLWVAQGGTALGVSIARAENFTTVADTKINTFWQFTQPVPEGIGDLWVDTSVISKPLYRWTNFAWQQVLNWTSPLYDALGVKISTYYQPTPPTSTATGDIWYDTSNGNLPYRADTPGATAIGADQWIEIPAGTGAIASGAIDATKIAAQSITATLLESNLILSSAISTGTIDLDTTSATFGRLIGQRVELSPYGIRLVDASGQDIVTLPVDLDQPATFNGQITTGALRVLGGTSIEGTGNEIAAGGSIRISNGIAKPVQGPTLTNAYESVQLDQRTTTVAPTNSLGRFAFDPSQVTAFAYDVQAGGWLVAQKRANGTRVWRFTLDGAIQLRSDGSYWVQDLPDWIVSGLTSRAGGLAFDYVGHWNDAWWIVGRVPSDPNIGERNRFIRGNVKTWPTLGYDNISNTYMIAETDEETNRVNIRKVQIVDGVGNFPTTTQSINLATGSGRVGSLSSILFDSFDYGSNHYIYTARGGYQAAWATNASGVSLGDDGFPTAVSSPIGFGYDGSNFWTLSMDGTVYMHSAWMGTSPKLFAGITYYDSNPTGGLHETTLGTVTGVTRSKRANVLATLPAIPDNGGVDDPDRWRLYTAQSSSSAPAASAFHLQATGVGPTPFTPGTLMLTSTDETGAAPPSVNSFPSGEAGELFSAGLDANGQPLISLMGDGSGRLGPYQWDAGEVDSGWVTVSPATGFTVSGNVRCRRIGKLVEVEVYSVLNGSSIAVNENGSVTDTDVAIVPAGFRPPAPIRVGGFCGRGAWFVLGTAGNIVLTSADANGLAWTIGASSALSCHFMFYLN